MFFTTKWVCKIVLKTTLWADLGHSKAMACARGAWGHNTSKSYFEACVYHTFSFLTLSSEMSLGTSCSDSWLWPWLLSTSGSVPEVSLSFLVGEEDCKSEDPTPKFQTLCLLQMYYDYFTILYLQNVEHYKIINGWFYILK